jgi:hypothetical protein
MSFLNVDFNALEPVSLDIYEFCITLELNLRRAGNSVYYFIRYPYS